MAKEEPLPENWAREIAAAAVEYEQRCKKPSDTDAQRERERVPEGYNKLPPDIREIATAAWLQERTRRNSREFDR